MILTIGGFTNSKMTNPNTEMPSHTRQSPLYSKKKLWHLGFPTLPWLFDSVILGHLLRTFLPFKIRQCIDPNISTQILGTAESGWLISFVRRTSGTLIFKFGKHSGSKTIEIQTPWMCRQIFKSINWHQLTSSLIIHWIIFIGPTSLRLTQISQNYLIDTIYDTDIN